MIHVTERPSCFEEFLGNEAVVTSVSALVRDAAGPHVFLFHGPSGIGKTTLARICAGEVGGEGLGVLEMNISNETGVDGARKIAADMYAVPMQGRSLVYILDEVDKASASWQSAMKKPLEEVPEHTYFFLCTEVPAKLSKAIHTRSATYELKRLSDEDMLCVLKHATRKHKKPVAMRVLEAILEKAEGSPREGLVLVEQVWGFEDEDEALEVIAAEGGSADVRQLCQLLLKKATWKETAKVVLALREDPESIRRSVLGYMQAVLLRGGQERAFDIIDVFRDSLFYSGKPGLTAMCYEAVKR